MRTPYGEIPEDDIRALEFRLGWYLRYGCMPSARPRNRSDACMDYGNQYERYVGYLFASRGFSVKYTGIRQGVEDGGIDLIAHAPRKYRLVQCKRWHATVGCDVIARLHGAVERFRWEYAAAKGGGRMTIRGVLVTSGEVEEAAEEMARHFGIYVLKKLPYAPYPAIKAQRIVSDGGRFLLPGDSQYDSIVIRPRRGDVFFIFRSRGPAHGILLSGVS